MSGKTLHDPTKLLNPSLTTNNRARGYGAWSSMPEKKRQPFGGLPFTCRDESRPWGRVGLLGDDQPLRLVELNRAHANEVGT